jgi:hypothetical protein
MMGEIAVLIQEFLKPELLKSGWIKNEGFWVEIVFL